MLISAKSLFGYRVGTSDGLAGTVIDFNFDDRTWAIQHIVASQHPTRRNKGVLIEPAQVQSAQSQEQVLSVGLTRGEYERLPSAAAILPVCLQYGLRGGARPGIDAPPSNPHLRCVSAVTGYEIHDAQRHLGVVHDFLIDTDSWAITFLVGRRFGQRASEFLTQASSVAQISWASRRVAIRENAHWDLVFAARNGYDSLLQPTGAF